MSGTQLYAWIQRQNQNICFQGVYRLLGKGITIISQSFFLPRVEETDKCKTTAAPHMRIFLSITFGKFFCVFSKKSLLIFFFPHDQIVIRKPSSECPLWQLPPIGPYEATGLQQIHVCIHKCLLLAYSILGLLISESAPHTWPLFSYITWNNFLCDWEDDSSLWMLSYVGVSLAPLCLPTSTSRIVAKI